MKREQLARLEQSQGLQTLLLIFIAAQFAPAWSTGDVVFTVIAGAVVVLMTWLAWKILRVVVRTFAAHRRIGFALLLLAYVGAVSLGGF